MFSHHKTSEETWNAIAQSFDATRRKPWEQCVKFISNLPKKSAVIDLGCGNGRHLIPCAERCKKTVGLDISKNLLNIVKKKIKEKRLNNVLLLHSNLTNLPLKDDSVDAVLFIASLHNIKCQEQRVKSLNEVRRILRKDGTALIGVWSRWQDRFRMYFLKEWLKKRKTSEFGDIELLWKQHGLNVPRFYHLYSKNEFLQDLKAAGLKIVDFKAVKLKSKRHADNFFVIVKN
ncbi:methylase involved in ubiquinone/menaquinone biosynthesis [Thermoplasmatales archaeon SCGC AB-539-N05]|nr:methylase involved in ubiquinone/menaquinone biosynthesis [Thermoplasmatales archaeon SCGC AB-539-N05]